MDTIFSLKVSLKSFLMALIVLFVDGFLSFYLINRIEEIIPFLVMYCMLVFFIYSLIGLFMKIFFCRLRIYNDDIYFYDFSDFLEYRICINSIKNTYIEIFKTPKATIIKLVISFILNNKIRIKKFSVYRRKDMDYFIDYVKSANIYSQEHVYTKKNNRLIIILYLFAFIYLAGIFFFVLLKPVITGNGYLFLNLR